MDKYVSRAGEKLEYAVNVFGISVVGLVCADFGFSTGGFADCLLQLGAKKVYAIDTGYGVLDWKLRNDSRVVVIERTNAMHVVLPEKVDLITIDVGWTHLASIIPNAFQNLKPEGRAIALLKPHYEAEARMLRAGKLSEDFFKETVERVKNDLLKLGFEIVAETESPILGGKGKNKEYFLLLALSQ